MTRHCELRLKFLPLQSISEPHFQYNSSTPLPGSTPTQMGSYKSVVRPPTPGNYGLLRSLESFEHSVETEGNFGNSGWLTTADVSNMDSELDFENKTEDIRRWLKDKAVYEKAHLQEEKDSLKSKVNQQEKRLAMWKKREQQHENDLRSLRMRIDEMARVIRSKDKQIDKLSGREQQYLAEIDMLRKDSQEGGRVVRLYTRQSYPQFKSDKPALKLPSIVKKTADKHEVQKLLLPNKFTKLNAISRSHEEFGRHQNRNLNDAENHLVVSENTNGGGITKEALPNGCLKAVWFERWVSIQEGSKIHLPNSIVFIPPNAVDADTLIRVHIVDQQADIHERICAASLSGMAEAILQIYIEPQERKLKKPFYIDIQNAKQSEQVRYLAFQKEHSFSKKTEWELTEQEGSLRFMKSGALRIDLQRFCSVQVLKVYFPVAKNIGVSVGAGCAVGQNSQAQKSKLTAYNDDFNVAIIQSIINNNISVIEFSMYHNLKVRCLLVFAHIMSDNKGKSDDKQEPPTSSETESLKSESTGTKVLLAKGQSSFTLCHNDRLYFYFDGQKKWQLFSILNLHEIKTGLKQVFKLPLSNRKGVTNQNAKLPRVVTISRRISDRLDEQTVVSLNLQHLTNKENSQSESLLLRNFTNDTAQRVLSQLRVKVVQTVDIRQILDLLYKERLFTFEEQKEITNEKTPQSRAKCFIDKLVTKGPKGMVAFCSALEEDYPLLAHDFKALLQSTH